MVNCAVSGCRNYSDKGDKKIRYFSFPTSDEIKRLWISACNRNYKFNPKNAKICGEHFTDDDWTLKDRLLNVPLEKRRLKYGAVPTKNLIYKEKRVLKIERDERAQKRKRKQLVNEILSAEKLSSKSKSEDVLFKTPIDQPKKVFLKTQIDQTGNIIMLELETQIDQTENVKICDKASQTEIHMEFSKELKNIMKLLAENRCLKRKLKENEKQCNDANKLKSLCYHILSPEQMKRLAIAIQKNN